MNTEVKHTPGPWQIYRPEASGCGLGIDTSDGKRSVVVFDTEAGIYSDNPEEQEANAKLIAAAPELLEALQIARRIISEGNHSDIWNSQDGKIIELAIKKATV